MKLSSQEGDAFLGHIVEFVAKRNSACIEDTVERRHNYLYIHSSVGAFSVILFRMAVIILT